MTHLHSYRVLFPCTGNSARIIMTDALPNVLGHAVRVGYSRSRQKLRRASAVPVNARAANLDEFTREGAPAMDFVITICDSTAGETCPVWFGSPLTAHGSVPDPVHVAGGGSRQRATYRGAADLLRKRIEAMVAFPDARPAGHEVPDVLREIARAGAESHA